jgi:hypothetical protein
VVPRKILVVSSDNDPFSADADELVAAVSPRFGEAGASTALSHFRTGSGHALDRQRFDKIVDWLASFAS